PSFVHAAQASASGEGGNWQIAPDLTISELLPWAGHPRPRLDLVTAKEPLNYGLMGRIHKALENRFRTLLVQVGARKTEDGVRLLMKQTQQLSEKNHIPLPIAASLVAQRFKAPSHKKQSCAASVADLRFYCDAGLGGLARWLRAAGYDAFWEPDISDD